MWRRAFIRLVGGGVVVAAAGPGAEPDLRLPDQLTLRVDPTRLLPETEP